MSAGSDKKEPPEMLVGTKLKIVFCDGAMESFNKELLRVPKAKRLKIQATMRAQFKRLADGHLFSRDTLRKEGPLPRTVGSSSPRNFYALKKIPMRAYCWKSDKHAGTWFVSHFKYKDQTKLNSKDTAIVSSNWRRIEELDHDS